MTEILYPTNTIWWVLDNQDVENPYAYGSTTPEQETTSALDIIFQTEDEQEWIDWLLAHGIDPYNPETEDAS
jgi:hypothetical protein